MVRFSSYVVSVLSDAFQLNSQPSNDEYMRLAIKTGLDVLRVKRWFCDKLRSIKKAKNKTDTKPQHRRTIVRFTPAQRQVLMRHLEQEPYPSEEEVKELATQLGVNQKKVVNWFSSNRYRWWALSHGGTHRGLWNPSNGLGWSSMKPQNDRDFTWRPPECSDSGSNESERGVKMSPTDGKNPIDETHEIIVVEPSIANSSSVEPTLSVSDNSPSWIGTFFTQLQQTLVQSNHSIQEGVNQKIDRLKQEMMQQQQELPNSGKLNREVLTAVDHIMQTCHSVSQSCQNISLTCHNMSQMMLGLVGPISTTISSSVQQPASSSVSLQNDVGVAFHTIPLEVVSQPNIQTLSLSEPDLV